MAKYRVGQKVFILISGKPLEVTIWNRSGEFYMVKTKQNGGIRLRESRIFELPEDAITSRPKEPPVKKYWEN